jgi:hypothetical protein
MMYGVGLAVRVGADVAVPVRVAVGVAVGAGAVALAVNWTVGSIVAIWLAVTGWFELVEDVKLTELQALTRKLTKTRLAKRFLIDLNPIVDHIFA